MAHKWESTIGRGIPYKVVEVLEIVIFLSDGIAYIMLFCEGIYLILLRYFNGVELINSSVVYYFMYTFVLSVALFLQKSWRPKSCCYGSKRVSSKNSSVLIIPKIRYWHNYLVPNICSYLKCTNYNYQYKSFPGR